MKPTAETYSELQQAYDTFNARLFAGQLPECLITLQRSKNVCGYFSANRFANRQGKKIDEIAMNPAYFAVMPIIEILQTLAHEACHLWQHHHGKPGRGRYHNAQWADKMEEIGLMPSSTGKPGGKKTGDHIADYAIDGGLFLSVCADLLTQDFRISWYDRFVPRAAVVAGQNSFSNTLAMPASVSSAAALSEAEMVSIEVTEAAQGNKSNRVKYVCGCGNNVWGKPGIRLACCDCGSIFEEQG